MFDFRMPSLGADMEAGRLLEWKVKPGDRVTRGQVVAVVDTDKAAIEVEIWKTGIVREILIQKGEKVPVGTVLARVELAGEAHEEALPEETRLKETRPAAAAVTGPLQGSAGTRSPIQKVIARAMETSKREIPHYYLSRRVCIDPLLEWIGIENARRSVEDPILPIAPLVWAVARACGEQPLMNGHFREGEFLPAATVNPALVISLRSGGSIAPALLDAGSLTIPEIMVRIRDLVIRSREGSGIRSSEFGEGTITVTNLMDSGVDRVFGVIHPPQVALVGIGTPFCEAFEKGSGPCFRTVVEVSLSGDHRVSDGRIGARFLGAIDEHLQGPGKR